MRYWLTINGKVEGPYYPQELLRMGCNASTLVCVEGGNEWQYASYVPELSTIMPEPAVPVTALPATGAQTGKGLIGLALSAVALIAEIVFWNDIDKLSFLLQLIVSIVGIVGLVYCIKGFKEKNKTFAGIGLTVNIIALIASLFFYELLLAKGSISMAGSLLNYM